MKIDPVVQVGLEAGGLSRAAASGLETAAFYSFSGTLKGACQELTPSLVAHQRNVPGVVEGFVNEGHLGPEEGTLDGSVNEPDEIQSNRCRKDGGQPAGNLSVTYGLS